MHALCIQCAKALLLKSLIAESSIYAPCNVCGTPGLQVIDTSDLKFIRAIKALIRYHYSEWEYHGRLGGESFQHLLSIENPIIRLNPKLDEIEYEESASRNAATRISERPAKSRFSASKYARVSKASA